MQGNGNVSGRGVPAPGQRGLTAGRQATVIKRPMRALVVSSTVVEGGCLLNREGELSRLNVTQGSDDNLVGQENSRNSRPQQLKPSADAKLRPSGAKGQKCGAYGAQPQAQALACA